VKRIWPRSRRQQPHRRGGFDFELQSRAVFAVAWVAIIAWRIHIEETALLSTLGGKYRSYASHHKRLIPLIW
jgi:hypothetical protein